ncbi:BAHD acyltransferase DCR, partial [Amborella trichopoda]
VNHEQVTELSDGLFIGCSMNHTVADGSSFWSFFNSWAEISRGDGSSLKISQQPVLEPWFLKDRRIAMNLSEDTLERYSPPPLTERFFHFSAQSIALLKHKANMHIDEDGSGKISSLQSLTALMWRAVTRARGFPPTQTTKCGMAAGNRSRLSPPLSPDYFGNCIQAIAVSTTVGELLSQELGWAASMLRQATLGHTDVSVRAHLEVWMKAPRPYHLSNFDPFSIVVGSSPRFPMYQNDFGWGIPLAVRSGNANKFDGKISAYQGREGEGSMDMEVCLAPQVMTALESDQEFLAAVTYL